MSAGHGILVEGLPQEWVGDMTTATRGSAAWLRELLEANGVTAAALAAHLGLPKSNVYRWRDHGVTMAGMVPVIEEALDEGAPLVAAAASAKRMSAEEFCALLDEAKVSGEAVGRRLSLDPSSVRDWKTAGIKPSRVASVRKAVAELAAEREAALAARIAPGDFREALASLDAPAEVLAEMLEMPTSTVSGWLRTGVPSAQVESVNEALARVDEIATRVDLRRERQKANARAHRAPRGLGDPVPGGKFGEKRRASGMSQTDIARALGVTPGAVSLWERDKVPPARVDDVSMALGVDIRLP